MLTFLCEKGLRREKNEDFIFIDEDLGLYVLADGMGGHQAGDFASYLSVIKFVEIFKEQAIVDTEIIKEIYAHVNNIIYDYALSDSEKKGMGTTLSLVTLNGNKLSFGHVGDSRIYIFKNNELTQMTEDQTMVAELVKTGAITDDEAKNHPQRNILLQAIGTETTVAGQFGELELMAGDIIVLMSDGIYNHLDDQELQMLLRENDSIIEVKDKIRKIVYEDGATDNLSLIIYQHEG